MPRCVTGAVPLQLAGGSSGTGCSKVMSLTCVGWKGESPAVWSFILAPSYDGRNKGEEVAKV